MKEHRVGITVSVITPRVPNFVTIVSGGDGTMDVADMGDEDLKRLGERWTEALIENAKDRRVARKQTP